MSHLGNAFQVVHMLGMKRVVRLVVDGGAGKNVPRQAGHFFLVFLKQVLDFIDFLIIMVSDLLAPDELEFRELQIVFVHDGERVVQISADAVAYNSEFHWFSPFCLNFAPTISSVSLVTTQLSPFGNFVLPAWNNCMADAAVNIGTPSSRARSP